MTTKEVLSELKKLTTPAKGGSASGEKLPFVVSLVASSVDKARDKACDEASPMNDPARNEAGGSTGMQAHV